MHLDDEQVQRLLHGELPPRAETTAREHLAGCRDCDRRVAEAERENDEVHALLRTLDHPAPPVHAEAVAARAHAARAYGHDRGLLRRAGEILLAAVRGFGHDRGLLRQAAGILLAAGIAGAAYAVPGSPVRAWVGAVVEWIGGRPDPASVAPAPRPAPDQGVAGISVIPGRQLLILFTSPQAEGQAQVSLTDGAEVVVRAPIGAATFTSDVDRLVIDNSGSSATFEIELPRAAPWIEIRVHGNRILLKEGPRITTEKPTAPENHYLLPLTHPGS